MVDEEGHAGHDGRRPDTCPAGPPDCDWVDEDGGLRLGVQTEFGAHGDESVLVDGEQRALLKRVTKLGEAQVESTRDGIREETQMRQTSEL